MHNNKNYLENTVDIGLLSLPLLKFVLPAFGLSMATVAWSFIGVCLLFGLIYYFTQKRDKGRNVEPIDWHKMALKIGNIALLFAI